MSQKPKIELIPWVHNAACRWHGDVINYIRSLPKNSTIAMEMTPGRWVFLGKMADIYVGKKPSIVRGGGGELELIPPESQLSAMSVQLLAAFEIMHECGKRNITIIPIEVHSASAMGQRTYLSDLPPTPKELISTAEFRLESFARNVQSALVKFSGSRLPVITGLGDMRQLVSVLKKKSITAAINTDIFPLKSEMHQMLQLHGDLYAALTSGSAAEVSKIVDDITRLCLLPRRESAKEVRHRIINELCAKAAKPERKLAERKQKFAARLTKQRRK